MLTESEIVTRYNRITSLLQVITEEHLRLGLALQKVQKEDLNMEQDIIDESGDE